MNTCKTCKWWGWRKYDPICDLSDTVQFPCKSSHMAGDDPAGMVDAEDYGGVLTGPDFGCIHYEEINKQLPKEHPGYATARYNPHGALEETQEEAGPMWH